MSTDGSPESEKPTAVWLVLVDRLLFAGMVLVIAVLLLVIATQKKKDVNIPGTSNSQVPRN